MSRTDPGLYFNPETREVHGATRSGALPGGVWVKIGDDPTLGLLAARRLVIEKGLAEDPTCVDWYGLRGGSAVDEDDLSAVICRFKADPKDHARGGGGNGLLDSVSARLRGSLRGLLGGEGHSPPAAMAPVPVRAGDRRG